MTRPPRSVISLNGSWEIAPGLADIPPTVWNSVIPVPGLIDLAAPSYPWQREHYHWYRRRFLLEAPQDYQAALLTIEQAMFGTSVWLNGCALGGDIACYTSQEYDCTGIVHAGDNELLVRVGNKETLPPESAVGKDQERQEFIPGIWGDVTMTFCGSPRVRLVQVIPHLEASTAEVRLWLAGANAAGAGVRLEAAIHEVSTGRRVAESSMKLQAPEESVNGDRLVTCPMRIPDLTLWSPDRPFLYEVHVQVFAGGEPADRTVTRFGMREFTISGGDFFLNGKKIFLRGGNIALHRFFSDADRGTLPWDLAWVKRLIIDIPKEHHFNFFRNHIGQLYNRWYDIADEHGMLFQNEWQFWTTTGTKEQIRKEFTRWLEDNWNHPSIIIWDPINESSDPVLQNEIVPEMKQLDPTRPWESVDFIEQHPYIYSLGPVLVDRKFGYTEALDAIEHSLLPAVINEFLWWWLDKDFQPALLTKEVVERWLGPAYTREELIAHQSFLARELIELFRRMRVDAIQPFVYLSNNAGPTAHWFTGNIADLQPKPLLATLKNAFAPFGVSIELWDRHFFSGEEREMRIFVFNDHGTPSAGMLRYGIRTPGGRWLYRKEQEVSAGPADCSIIPVTVTIPGDAGSYSIVAELSGSTGDVVAVSVKPAHVFDAVLPYGQPRQKTVSVIDARGDLARFLHAMGITTQDLLVGGDDECRVGIIAEGGLRSERVRENRALIEQFLDRGRTLIILEPEHGIDAMEVLPITSDAGVHVEKRQDIDKGGYDSYVFAADPKHPLWSGIGKEHLKMFNGGYGGEMVSEYTVTPSVPCTVHARCGLHLNVAAVQEFPVGNGRCIISRIQTRGRLIAADETGLYARRVDPVAQRYLLNLINYSRSLCRKYV